MDVHPVYGVNMSFGGSRHGQGQEDLPFKTTNQSLQVMLLHGNLDIWVKGAKNLPSIEKYRKKLGKAFGKFNSKLSSTVKGHKSEDTISGPHVTVSITGAIVGRTFVMGKTQNPVWMQHFNAPVAHYAAEVHFVVKESYVVASEIVGAVGIPVEQLCSGTKIEGEFPILNNGQPCNEGAVLSLSIQYTPIQDPSLHKKGVVSGPDDNGVPGTYFPLRRGCKVTLYQDAHNEDGCLPNLKLDGGMEFNHASCWQDIYDAISEARHLIYIAGWSLNHTLRLVRNGNDTHNLGDLLKMKSQHGVRVLLLVWDDPTSLSILGHKREGIMNTGDEETRRFLKHSSVQIILCPRSPGKGHNWVKKQAATFYAHHQKTVTVDADAGQRKRKIISFVGGLDLCKGRYDTPKHPLFSTSETLHKDDFHNSSFPKTSCGGPRQPWHDLHCRIDGPAAYDILTNFEERWLKASKHHRLEFRSTSNEDALLKLEGIPEIFLRTQISCLHEKDPEAWNVQVFRSIDSNSVKGFPKDPKDGTNMNLVCGRNVLIDMSIHAAYVKAIRDAQHFIYIENQYFIGSSFNWDSHKKLGANNLIPVEIALKIAKKIRAKERFSAYILIPMWPEGGNGTVQRILYWQHKTMQMMYETIYKALVEVGLENVYKPQDYLNFFCLGNREPLDGVNSSNAESSTETNTSQELCQKNRRFQIYIHSKGMIVDDEYVILGSANINQRSMDGTRDTEIAIGAYQPHHTWARKPSGPQGQVYGYRMSLWAEHIGEVEECFNSPESLECVRRVRSLGELNWGQYAVDEVTEMKAHLLNYPITVNGMGKVKPLPGFETFPDVGGYILGSIMPLTGIHENITT